MAYNRLLGRDRRQGEPYLIEAPFRKLPRVLTEEIGIRLALGAQLREVTGLFVRNGLAMAGIGAVFGLTTAFTLTRLMKSLLFEVSPADPATYAAASLGLIFAAVLGSYLPARRAASINPAEALRSE